jgi:hypothetical protein
VHNTPDAGEMTRTSPAIAASAAAVGAQAFAVLRKTLSRERFAERPLAVTLNVPGTGIVPGTTLIVTVYGDPASAAAVKQPASTAAAAPAANRRR